MLTQMGAFVRCWRCDRPFEPPQGGEPLCSRECARELRRARAQRGRRCCWACGKLILPQRRSDARFCSNKCYQRHYRWEQKREERESRVEAVRHSIVDDMREVHEALRWETGAKPSGYTPQGVRLRQELRHLDGVMRRGRYGGRDYRE